MCAHPVESMVARRFGANIAEELRVYLGGG
jgi:hypothetical protein